MKKFVCRLRGHRVHAYERPGAEWLDEGHIVGMRRRCNCGEIDEVATRRPARKWHSPPYFIENAITGHGPDVPV